MCVPGWGPQTGLRAASLQPAGWPPALTPLSPPPRSSWGCGASCPSKHGCSPKLLSPWPLGCPGVLVCVMDPFPRLGKPMPHGCSHLSCGRTLLPSTMGHLCGKGGEHLGLGKGPLHPTTLRVAWGNNACTTICPGDFHGQQHQDSGQTEVCKAWTPPPRSSL